MPMSESLKILFLVPCFFVLCLGMEVSSECGGRMEEIAETKKLVHVGVILDLNSPVGLVANACISMAISDFYDAHRNFTTRLSLHHRNSSDVLSAALTALDLIEKEEVNAIIGPQWSMQARLVIELGKKAQVPIISYSATSPSLSTTENHFFIRTTLDDSSQAKAIATIVQAYRWHEAILIYEDTEYGTGLIPYLADELQQFDIRLSSRFSISPDSCSYSILKMLTKVIAKQTRVIVVHMRSSLGSKLFSIAKEAAMISEGYAWIMTDGLSSLLDTMGAEVIDSMQGVLGIRPHVPRSKSLDKFSRRWNEIHSNSTKLIIYGLLAYDTVWGLAKAVEMAQQDCQGNSRASTLGRMIRNKLWNTRFRGLSGEFSLVKGQLQSSAFEIINVVHNQEQVIGYWTLEKGLTRELGKHENSNDSISGYPELKPPIWPGNTRATPRGWATPVDYNKFRIGVPVKPGFDAYIKVEQDRHSPGEFIVTGFCYDFFLEVLALLPFALPHKLIPFPISSNTSGGTYNELLYDVKLKKFDAAVGDITILANRSNYVDFTLPYLQSHVSMVVTKDDERKSMWIFLKPLSWQLWFTTGVAFICSGLVVWILEHHINDEFRGPPEQQVGTVFWFSFSILVFAHREKILNNLSKFVLIIWIFVVLILTQSYTASLASMLTVQRLKPKVIDVDELIKNGEFVGYETGSFVKDLLVKQYNFNESKLRSYGTPEEFDEALSKGSLNGGVSAIFGAQHCIEQFLAKYGNKYTTAGPTYKTAGLGFAFQQGSPLVGYISRAILSVTENKPKMDALEHKYFPQQDAFQLDERTRTSSDSLNLYSFGGLFIITAVASACSLVVYFIRFFQTHWTAIHTDPAHHDSSVWSKIRELLKRFDSLSPCPIPARYVNATATDTSQSIEALDNVGNEGVDNVVVNRITRSNSSLYMM